MLCSLCQILAAFFDLIGEVIDLLLNPALPMIGVPMIGVPAAACLPRPGGKGGQTAHGTQ